MIASTERRNIVDLGHFSGERLKPQARAVLRRVFLAVSPNPLVGTSIVPSGRTPESILSLLENPDIVRSGTNYYRGLIAYTQIPVSNEYSQNFRQQGLDTIFESLEAPATRLFNRHGELKTDQKPKDIAKALDSTTTEFINFMIAVAEIPDTEFAVNIVQDMLQRNGNFLAVNKFALSENISNIHQPGLSACLLILESMGFGDRVSQFITDLKDQDTLKLRDAFSTARVSLDKVARNKQRVQLIRSSMSSDLGRGMVGMRRKTIEAIDQTSKSGHVISPNTEQAGHVIRGIGITGLEELKLRQQHAAAYGQDIAPVISYLEWLSMKWMVIADSKINPTGNKVIEHFAVLPGGCDLYHVQRERGRGGEIIPSPTYPELLNAVVDSVTAINRDKTPVDHDFVLVQPHELNSIFEELLYRRIQNIDAKIVAYQESSRAGFTAIVRRGVKRVVVSDQLKSVGIEGIIFRRTIDRQGIEAMVDIMGNKFLLYVDNKGTLFSPPGLSEQSTKVMQVMVLSYLDKIANQQTKAGLIRSREEPVRNKKDVTQNESKVKPCLRILSYGDTASVYGKIDLTNSDTGEVVDFATRDELTEEYFQMRLVDLNRALVDVLMGRKTIAILAAEDIGISAKVEVVLKAIENRTRNKTNGRTKIIHENGETKTIFNPVEVRWDDNKLVTEEQLTRRQRKLLKKTLTDLGLTNVDIEEYFSNNIAPFFITFIPETGFGLDDEPLEGKDPEAEERLFK